MGIKEARMSDAVSPDCNPHLVAWRQPRVHNEAGTGTIEAPGEGVNLRWQTRSAPPTTFENALGDAIEEAYLQGLSTPEQFSNAWNATGLRTLTGAPWTASLVEQEMARLGA
jgi:hypothetical protein